MASKLTVYGVTSGFMGSINPKCTVKFFLDGKPLGTVSKNESKVFRIESGGILTCKAISCFKCKTEIHISNKCDETIYCEYMPIGHVEISKYQYELKHKVKDSYDTLIGVGIILALCLIITIISASGSNTSNRHNNNNDNDYSSSKDYFKENFPDVYDYMEREGF